MFLRNLRTSCAMCDAAPGAPCLVPSSNCTFWRSDCTGVMSRMGRCLGAALPGLPPYVEQGTERTCDQFKLDKAVHLPELGSRNWSGQYFFHTDWNVSKLFWKYPSPLQAKERIIGFCHTHSVSSQLAGYLLIQSVDHQILFGQSVMVSWQMAESRSK